jgi:hypothetical protein
VAVPAQLHGHGTQSPRNVRLSLETVASLPASSRRLVLTVRCPFPLFDRTSLAKRHERGTCRYGDPLASVGKKRTQRRNPRFTSSGCEWPILHVDHSAVLFDVRVSGPAITSQLTLASPAVLGKSVFAAGLF